MRAFRRLFSSGMDRVRDELKAHVALSLQAMALVEGLLAREGLEERELDEAVRRIAALEREADEIVRELGDAMTQGAVVPTITHVLMVLLDNVDNVMDTIYFVAKEVRRGFPLWTNGEVRALVRGRFREMMSLNRTMLEYLNSLLSARSLEEAKRYAGIIATLEEEVDEVKEAALDEVYRARLNAVEFNHLTALIFTADRAADNLQDAAFNLVTALASL